MKVPRKSNLRSLVAQLKKCPSQDNRCSEKVLRETWETFKYKGWECAAQPTRAVLAGLILYDEHFARLLNEAERSQLVALSQVALERYQHQSNPPNKLGKTIAASLKESP